MIDTHLFAKTNDAYDWDSRGRRGARACSDCIKAILSLDREGVIQDKSVLHDGYL
jgi:hypothetical protein